MIEEITKVEELLNKVKAFSGKNDYCVFCYANQEKQTRKIFPCEKIHIIPERCTCSGSNNKVFIIPVDKPIKVTYEI